MIFSSFKAPPPELVEDLAACGLEGIRLSADGDPALSGTRGAYALLVHLRGRIPLDVARLAIAALGPGWYVYAGSAYGPGGLKARLARHMRAAKRLHWHVDRLTARSRLWAIAVPGGDECAIVRALAGHAAFGPAAPGFGSSDCGSCESHLLRWRTE